MEFEWSEARNLSGIKRSGSSEQDTGEKEENAMKKKIKYTKEPDDVDINSAKIINDFLPPPDELVFKEKNIKITLALSEKSVRFFKREADKHGVKYQQMIRSLIDKYVSAHSSHPEV